MPCVEFAVPEGSGRRRPIVPIEIIFQNMKLNAGAMVDSGADWRVFGIRVAQELGIDLGNCERRQTIGVGGRTEVFLHEVEIMLCGKRVGCKVAFSNLLTSYNLPGREPIFVEFDFHFKAREKKLVVTPV